jgi:hypothetical protein
MTSPLTAPQPSAVSQDAAAPQQIDISQVPSYEKLLGHLAAGVSIPSAALAVGLSEQDVRELLENKEFSAALTARRSEKLEAAVKHDATVESLETKALRVLEQKLPFVRSPMEAARIFQILNSSNKRSAPVESADAGALGAQQVAILLPKAARVQLTLNSSNQVIDVEGRSMATLPSRALPMLKQLSQEQATKKDELQEQEQAAAIKRLDSVSPLTTVINGVVKVL